MSEVLDIMDEYEFKKTHDTRLEFEQDISHGLNKTSKQISSKYLYDEHGCELFDKITRHPDYYLTQCELEILTLHKKRLSQFIKSEPFNLVELGPGEGIKTHILLDQFFVDKLNFTYLPIDISTQYLKKLAHYFTKKIPTLDFVGIHSDYFRGLEWINTYSTRRNVVLFLGSSIGNFDVAATHQFLRHLWQTLNAGDYVLLGFDLRKNIHTLMRAYSDDAGITRDFNLNLLQRINRELGGNFILDQFHHYATYNVNSGAMESYLVSLVPQVVQLKNLQKSFEFREIEAIHVEFSFKYHLEQVAELANETGFTLLENFTDKKNYFADSLWQVVK